MPASDLPPILRWEDVAAPKGTVHIVHGLAEHPGRYARLARALNGAGLIVWAHAHRGHGDNPLPGIRGHFADEDGWRLVVDDAWAVSKALRDARPGLPLILFAHSMGSFVGQRVVVEHGASYAGAVFSGTNGPPLLPERMSQGLARLQVTVLGQRNPGTWFQTLVIENTYNKSVGPNAPPNSWLSRDEDEVRKYNQDPQCNFALSSQAWLDLVSARVAQGTVAFFKPIPSGLPVHLISGMRDPVGELGKGVPRLRETLAEAGLSRVSSKYYDGARHELVNETNRDEVTADLITWMRGVIG